MSASASVSTGAAAGASAPVAAPEMAATAVDKAPSATLISVPAPIATLKKELGLKEKAETEKVESLEAEYPNVRRLTEDGNSFYRGYLFGVLDWISSTLRHDKVSHEQKEEVQHVIDAIDDSIEYVQVAANIETKTAAYATPRLQEAHGNLMKLIRKVQTDRSHAKDIVTQMTTDANQDQFVLYLRCMTSAYLATHDSYLQHLPDWIDPAAYRRQFIEATAGGHDGGWAVPIILARATGAGVRIVSVLQDGDQNKDRTYPTGATPRVCLIATRFEKLPEAPKEAQKNSKMDTEKAEEAVQASKDGVALHAAHATSKTLHSWSASAKKAVGVAHSTQRPTHYDWVEYTPAARSCMVPGTGVQCVVQ